MGSFWALAASLLVIWLVRWLWVRHLREFFRRHLQVTIDLLDETEHRPLSGRRDLWFLATDDETWMFLREARGTVRGPWAISQEINGPQTLRRMLLDEQNQILNQYSELVRVLSDIEEKDDGQET